MVKALRGFLRLSVLQCSVKKAFHPRVLPMRSVQNRPEKKLKPCQSLTASSKNLHTSPQCDDSSNLMDVHKMSGNERNDESLASGKNRSSSRSINAISGDKKDEKSFEDDTMRITEKENASAGGNDGGTLEAKERVKVEYLDVPVKSQNDKKDYRVIKLENGLTALLISDMHSREASSQLDDDDNDNKMDAIPSENEDEEEDDEDDDEEGSEEGSDDGSEEDDEESEEDDDEFSDERANVRASKRVKKDEKMAACGLCVGVGSFSDPPEIQGLAHFLEHMVFMGSEKYPQENDFDAFIKKRGGSDNASTDCEQTTFFFDVQEKHILATLDRFAQFFIKPLMKVDAIAREREAVESEFQMALPYDLYRKEQLFCSFARPNHPASKFSWGNLVTLRDNVTDEKLYEELHKFRERHYSAHRMKVALQARLPLDTLEEYVTQCFANVPSNGLPPDDFTEFKGQDSFATENFKKLYMIKPIKDTCNVELSWTMPPLHDLYRSKPNQYIAWIIEHEGKGSLISYLRKKMWCLDINKDNGESGFEHSSMYALFRVSLRLTDAGHQHLQEVLDAVFSYINLLRREGPQKRIYDEISQMEETNFRFADEDPPAEYVEDLCENMHFYPPKDYITGNDLFFEYNPEAITKCLEYLSPENVNIMVLDHKLNDDQLDKVEPWFKTEYTNKDIPEEWTQRWKTIEPLPEFHLPLPNVFIPDDFSLITLPAKVPKYPINVHSDDICEIWYRPDPKFRLPECYMYFYLEMPVVFSSAKNAAMVNLFVSKMHQLLAEELYPAATAGQSQEIHTRNKGLVIKLYGYSQKILLVLNTIVKCIANFEHLVTKDLFKMMKKQKLKEYYNVFLKPSELVKDVKLAILVKVYWTAMDKHAALSTVEYDEFLDFIRNFTKHIYIQVLVQGNIVQEDAVKAVQNCVEILKCSPPDSMPEMTAMQIPVGTQYCKVKNFNEADRNSVVTNHYQSGVETTKLAVIIELLIMIMDEPLFHHLRTKEQLGYNVFCQTKDLFGVLGYSITVCTQADKYSTEHVDERIENFLQDFIKLLKDMSQKELDSAKEALIKQKRTADIDMKVEVERNWTEIANKHYIFDRVDRELAAIGDITLEELIEWMTNHTINGNNLRKLSVQVIGTAKTEEKDNKDSTDESENSMQEKHGNVKYPLAYVSPSESQREKAPGYYVTDIEEYKRSLCIYPVVRNG